MAFFTCLANQNTDKNADTIWGIGLAQDSEKIYNPNTWKGLNLLGFALMEVRDRLSNE